MSEKYIELRQAIFRDLRDRGRPIAVSIGDVLNWLDEHPEQVPGRTITESDLKVMTASLIAYEGPNMEGRIQRHLTHFGVTVVPEPTNAEKLKAVLDAIGDSTAGYREHLASKLDDAGVKAPGGDDDH